MTWMPLPLGRYEGGGWHCPDDGLMDWWGRYHLLRYRLELAPPLAPEDAQWVDDRLRQSGLRYLRYLR